MFLFKIKTIICLLIIVSLFSGCGLPNYTSSSTSNLNKPRVEVYNEVDAIKMRVTGYYPANEYPFFLGYNIYLGDNNDASKIAKRVLYIDDKTRLPSKSVPLSFGNSAYEITIPNFRFRFTQDATDLDLQESGSARGDLLSRGFVPNEKYYFLVEAQETSRVGVRSDIIEVVFIDYQSGVTFNYGETLTGLGGFSTLKVNKDYFEIVDPTKVFSQGYRESVFGIIPKNSLNYVNQLMKPILSHIYFFNMTQDENVEYLMIFVESINNNGLVVSRGYEKAIFTDLNTGLTKVQ